MVRSSLKPVSQESHFLEYGDDIPSGTTDLGEGELHAPHLTLVAQTVFADDFQLGVAVALLGHGP